MNISNSECSRGYESGWTMYLDQLSNSANPYGMNYVQNYDGKGVNVNEDQEDDMSMVSDASSGPPHLHENYGFDPQYYGYPSSVQEDTKKSKQKSKAKETRAKKQHNLCLDDTAGSAMIHFSGNYNSFEGILYCRPHFDQLFKRTGSLEKSFEGMRKIAKPEKPADLEVSVNGTSYHKAVSSAAMEDVSLVHPITLHTRAVYTANITMFNLSRRKAT